MAATPLNWLLGEPVLGLWTTFQTPFGPGMEVGVGVPAKVGVAIGVAVRVAVGGGLGVRVFLAKRLACVGCASAPASTARRVLISTNSASCFRIMFIENPPIDCFGEKPEREVLS